MNSGLEKQMASNTNIQRDAQKRISGFSRISLLRIPIELILHHLQLLYMPPDERESTHPGNTDLIDTDAIAENLFQTSEVMFAAGIVRSGQKKKETAKMNSRLGNQVGRKVKTCALNINSEQKFGRERLLEMPYDIVNTVGNEPVTF